MLPLSAREIPERSTVQERQMTQEVADEFSDYINDDLYDLLSDYIADVLKKNNIDLDSREGDDLFQDISNRITVNVTVKR